MHPNSPALPHAATTEGHLIHWASRYDLVVDVLTLGQARRLRQATVSHARLQPGDHVLDVGCGTGAVTLAAQRAVGDAGLVAGIDPSIEMIAAARAKARHTGVTVDFRLAMIEALPFPDASFDAVTASLMMHHLPPLVQEKGLVEVLRVLKPGGRLLVVDLMRPSGAVWRSLSAAIARHHGYSFGVEDLLARMTDAGFASAEMTGDRVLIFGFARATKRGA